MFFKDTYIGFTNEELLKIIEEEKDKNYVLLSTSILHQRGNLVSNCGQAKLFALRNIEAENLAHEVSQQLIINAECNDGKSSLPLELELFFEGSYSDLPNGFKNMFIDIENYKNNVIAIKRIITGYKSEPSSVYRYQTVQVPIYEERLIDFKKFLSILKENGVSYSVEFPNIGDRHDERFSKFIFSYTKENTRKKDQK